MSGDFHFQLTFEFMGRKAPKKLVKFSSELGELICSLLAEGQSLRKICSIDSMPRVSTVMYWLAKGAAKTKPFDAFLEQYAIAREAQAQVYVDQIIDIADDDEGDFGFKSEDTEEGASGKPVVLIDNVHRAKLRVDARKWIASKLLPKKYGEKIQQEHSTKDDKPIPIFTLNIGQKTPDA
ncbi:MAG TPA: hypothetical protein VHW09_26915 [Bryobacteraceae bacterium]|nr:hypothetical protein [Bryobacteraceae bacterium]